MKEEHYSKEELLSTIRDLNQRILDVDSVRGEGKWLEGALRRRTHDLSERVKELECLYGLLHFSAKFEGPIERNAEKLIQIIKNGWQYPEAASVRIKWNEKEFKSLNFVHFKHKQMEPIVQKGKRVGEVEVGYTQEKPNVWQGPFLKEEAKLLRAIASYLSLLLK